MFASRLYEQVRMAGFLLLLRLTAPSFNPRLRKIAICATTGGGRILLLSWWRSGELLDYFLDEPESVKLPSRALPFEVVKLASDHRGWCASRLCCDALRPWHGEVHLLSPPVVIQDLAAHLMINEGARCLG